MVTYRNSQTACVKAKESKQGLTSHSCTTTTPTRRALSPWGWEEHTSGPSRAWVPKCCSRQGWQVLLAPLVDGKSSDGEINGLLVTGRGTKFRGEHRGCRSGPRHCVPECGTPQTYSPPRVSSATRARFSEGCCSVEGVGIWPKITFLPQISSSLKLQELFCTPILPGQAQTPGDQCCVRPELSTSP